MQQIYSDNLTAEDQKVARRIYLGLASCYAGLLCLLGALVIVAAWVLTWIYVRWANTHYDAQLRGLRR